MPQEELMKWGLFFRRRPLGWREDQRTFLLLQAQGYKGEPGSIFASLKQLKENIPAEVKSLPKGKFLEMMVNSSDKDGSGWTPPWIGEK
jgi:hypothetical protein